MKNILEKTQSIAHDLKVPQFDIIVNKGSSLSLSAQQNKLETYKVSSSSMIGIRVIKDQKVGISYSEDFSDDSLKTMVKSALKSSEFSGVDEYQEITLPKSEIIDSNQKTYRDDKTEINEKIDFALKLESEIKNRDKKAAAVPYNGYSEGESHSYYTNQNGLYVYERAKSFSCYTSSQLKDGTDLSMHYEGIKGRVFKDLNYHWLIDETLSKANLLLKAKPIPTGKYDVIFYTSLLDEFLVHFISIFSGKAVKEGMSRLKNEVGNSIAHPEFSLLDSPQYQDGFYFNLTDSEGFLKKDLTLIDKGTLKSFYHNSSTAKYFKVENTAHGARDPKGQLRTVINQLIIKPGSSSEKSLKSGKYLELFSLQGLNQANPVSGEFSAAANGGIYENGELIQGVKGITISGNFFDMLKNISGVGNVLHSDPSKTFFSPTIRFSDISVAGI